IRPFYQSTVFKGLYDRYPSSLICLYNPLFGLIPAEISDIYPASHNVFSKHYDHYEPGDYDEFIKLLYRFIEINNFNTICIIANSFMKKLIPKLKFSTEIEIKTEEFKSN
ncbi:MAG: hypothetical protein M3162_04075, partial [Thermoproteota archaeon]|nr:hypothetical protein [Thermoproteota archaeon]